MAPVVLTWEAGKLVPAPSNLNQYPGWWYAIAFDDVDGDGDQDLILGNRGENFYFSGSPEAPAKLWVSDFDNNGTIEKVITQSLQGRDMPLPMKSELTGQVVSLKKQNLRHAEYANRSIQELFSADVIRQAYQIQATYFRSAVAINEGNGQFSLKPLPPEVQFSCVCDIYCTDLNGDGRKDLILGGNDSGFTPQFSRLDASFGHVLLNQGDGTYQRLESGASGLFIRGDIKQWLPLKMGQRDYLLTLINQQAARMFMLPTAKMPE